MTYQIVRSENGRETILLDTDSRREATNFYLDCQRKHNAVRIRVDGETLLIHEADEFAGYKGRHAVKARR